MEAARVTEVVGARLCDDLRGAPMIEAPPPLELQERQIHERLVVTGGVGEVREALEEGLPFQPELGETQRFFCGGDRGTEEQREADGGGAGHVPGW